MKTKNSDTHLKISACLLLICLGFIGTAFGRSHDQVTLLYQNWESGWGSWWANNGQWEVGVPTVGPDTTYSPTHCAATILNGNYSSNANTRLTSPQITLPSLPPGEVIQLKFWQWFQIDRRWDWGVAEFDEGHVQIQVNNGEWQNLLGPIYGSSPVWSQVCLDLSAYADSSVRIGFLFTSSGLYEDCGWYLDDIKLEVAPVLFNNPESFELGIGDWWADNGVWEVGVPTVGPDTTYSPTYCAGTILNSNYPPGANTRLISPQITLPILPSGEVIQLKFWQWFQIDRRWDWGVAEFDEGHVQIQVNNGEWQNLLGPIYGSSPVWSHVCLDLSAYADSCIRVGFLFTSSGNYQDCGWYLDDVKLEIAPVLFNNPESFELGIGDWWADNGIWEIGITDTLYGPDTTASGETCAGTILHGNYTNGDNTRLISTEIYLDGSQPELYFWQWFRIDYRWDWGVAEHDYGQVQIKPSGGEWETLGDIIYGFSEVWNQSYRDLSAFAYDTVRIAFYFTSSGSYVDNGWYIDDIRIEGVTGIEGPNSRISNPESFALHPAYPNPFNPTTVASYQLQVASHVSLKVYDTAGRLVATLVDGWRESGSHEVTFDGSGLPSGVYLARLQAGDFSQVQKLVLLK